MDIGLEEVEIAANMVQQAAHKDALIIFGATFDEELEDEIRVTVIATGFEEVNEPAQMSFSEAGRKIEAEKKQEEPAPAPAAPEAEEAAPEPPADNDPFEDIFRIFNKK
jgi:cell division protein FtsZ